MSDLGKVCEHGSLARSCGMCDLIAESAELDKTIEAWQEQDDRSLKYIEELQKALEASRKDANALAHICEDFVCGMGSIKDLSKALSAHEALNGGKL